MMIFYNALTGDEPYLVSEYWVTWDYLPVTSSHWLIPGTFEV